MTEALSQGLPPSEIPYLEVTFTHPPEGMLGFFGKPCPRRGDTFTQQSPGTPFWEKLRLSVRPYRCPACNTPYATQVEPLPTLSE